MKTPGDNDVGANGRLGDATFHALLDAAVDAIVVIEPGGTIEAFNASAQRLFGYRLEQVRGRNVHASEVEAVASRAHALIVAGGCAAVGRREGGTCTLVVLAEVPRAEVSSRTVPAAIREALAHAIDLVPSDVVLVPVGALPRTTSGKIRRRRCLEQYEAGAWPSALTARASEPAA